MANSQLHLIHLEDDIWKLDDRTIRIGRRGLASARAALAQANRSRREQGAGEPGRNDSGADHGADQRPEPDQSEPAPNQPDTAARTGQHGQHGRPTPAAA